MKSYLDLAAISGKVHKRQSRMTRICIILSVFLVTALFGMAEMEIRSQNMQAKMEYGDWHAGLKNISDEEMKMIAARPDVLALTRYDTLNYRVTLDYSVEGKDAAMVGFDETALEMFPSAPLLEGSFPGEKGQVLLDANTGERLRVRLGDEVILHTPEGQEIRYEISGFVGKMASLMKYDVCGLMMNMDSFRELSLEDTEDNYESFVYVRFSPYCNIEGSILEIQEAFGLSDEQIGRNTLLLSTMGQSKDPTILIIYAVALVLAVLVSAAGILMITGSMNSNVARRTEFFGMLRCLGADKNQIIRFVKREALGWCKMAIPAGIILATAVVWILCELLRFLSPRFFADMPVLGISWVGIFSGAVIGAVTVLLAARAPARRAAGVSPLTAVSGNANEGARVRRCANTRLFRVDMAIGVHHAIGSRKNLLLISGSFAFSIILFLSFNVLVDFMDHAVKPMRPYAPDISVVSPDNTCSVEKKLAEDIQELSGVKRVYGRSFAYDVPISTGAGEGRVDLISYEENQFRWAEKYLKEGSLEAVEKGQGILAVYDEANPIEVGDVITVMAGKEQRQVTVLALAAYSPFDSSEGTGTVICSQALFESLTGENQYTIIDIQLSRKKDDALVERIRSMAGDLTFSDARMSNSEVRGAMYGMGLFVYGFLAVIALIGVFNVVNSISMSASARMKQYGAMRAVGMDSCQIIRTVAAEAASYGVLGGCIGGAAGVIFNKILFQHMITAKWGSAWSLPAVPLALILAVMVAAFVLAVYGPAKKIRKMTVVEVLGVQ